MLVHSQSHTVEHVSLLLIDYPASHPVKETSDEKREKKATTNKKQVQAAISYSYGGVV